MNKVIVTALNRAVENEKITLELAVRIANWFQKIEDYRADNNQDPLMVLVHNGDSISIPAIVEDHPIVCMISFGDGTINLRAYPHTTTSIEIRNQSDDQIVEIYDLNLTPVLIAKNLSELVAQGIWPLSPVTTKKYSVLLMRKKQHEIDLDDHPIIQDGMYLFDGKIVPMIFGDLRFGDVKKYKLTYFAYEADTIQADTITPISNNSVMCDKTTYTDLELWTVK